MAVKLAKVTDNIEDERWLSQPSELVYQPEKELDIHAEGSLVDCN